MKKNELQQLLDQAKDEKLKNVKIVRTTTKGQGHVAELEHRGRVITISRYGDWLDLAQIWSSWEERDGP